jgi:hypothetical protein
MFGFSKIKYNFNDLKQLRLERSHFFKKNRVWKGQVRLPCSYVHHMHQHMGRDRCAQMVHATSFGNVLLSFMVAYCTTTILIIQCVFSLFSLSSPLLKNHANLSWLKDVMSFCLVRELILILLISIYYVLIFLKNFVLQHLISFNFYINFGPYYFDY